MAGSKRGGKISSLPIPSQDLDKWMKELVRLSREAERRFRSGNYEAAFSSLTAITPLSGVLVESCRNRIERSSSDGEFVVGVYL